MQDQILELHTEITAYEQELAKLQAELGELTRSQPSKQSDSPSAVAEAIKQAAVQVVERQPLVRGIQEAIAQLKSQLEPKLQQLSQLQKEQQRQVQLARIEEGRDKLRSRFEALESVSETLRSLFLDLKETVNQYESDFRAIYPPTSADQVLNAERLLNYGALWLPQITEEKGKFFLKSIRFNPFEAEKVKLQQQVREWNAELYRKNSRTREDLYRQRAEEKRQQQREELVLQMGKKREELQQLYNERDKFSSWRGVNLDSINRRTQLLVAEIKEIEAKIDNLDSNSEELL